ncbi:MAG TPA: hypothetical protein VHQ90_21610 [Thermoanaerobaculia bacterium]|nr:hypothetical protein [Thermoanaerobaculia bacterium]
MAGYGTAQELLTLRHEVWRYAPDLVLLAFYTGNDVRNNERRLEQDPSRPYFILRPASSSLGSPPATPRSLPTLPLTPSRLEVTSWPSTTRFAPAPGSGCAAALRPGCSTD